MAYDPQIKRLVLFGGDTSSGGKYLASTWEWNGSDWLRVTTPVHPSARKNAMMAWDSASKQLVLFGGTTISSDFADTWIFTNNNTWTLESPATSPPARYSGTFAYDFITNQLLLFGGWAHDGGTYYGDTWTWTGTTWSHLTPATSPPVRARATMSFDRATGQMILFGGWQPNNPAWSNDTWTWTGDDWTELSPTISPSPRADAAMAYDMLSKQIILFGGDASTNANANDTWTWQNG